MVQKTSPEPSFRFMATDQGLVEIVVAATLSTLLVHGMTLDDGGVRGIHL